MTDPRIASFIQEADKVLAFLHTEFSKLQTGRANAAIVEHVEVDAYGQRSKLNTIAGISVQDARSIVIQPWDKSILGAVEKAIQQSNLGINPVNDGNVIRLNLPPMTEERREQLKKIVHTLCEEARISIRQHRQKVHDEIKEIKEDDVKQTLSDFLQREVDKYNEKIEESRKQKEEEVMKV